MAKIPAKHLNLPPSGGGWTDDTYDSGWVAIATIGTYQTFTHNKNGLPGNLRFSLKCLTADDQWAVGEIYNVNVDALYGGQYQSSLEFAANSFKYCLYAGSSFVLKRTGIAGTNHIVISRWNIRAIASNFRSF